MDFGSSYIASLERVRVMCKMCKKNPLEELRIEE